MLYYMFITQSNCDNCMIVWFGTKENDSFYFVILLYIKLVFCVSVLKGSGEKLVQKQYMSQMTVWNPKCTLYMVLWREFATT